MKTTTTWIIERFSEKSTYMGLVKLVIGAMVLYCAFFRTPLYALAIAGAGKIVEGMINCSPDQGTVTQSQTSVVVLDRPQPPQPQRDA